MRAYRARVSMRAILRGMMVFRLLLPAKPDQRWVPDDGRLAELTIETDEPAVLAGPGRYRANAGPGMSIELTSTLRGMGMQMDYRALLARYIAHVGREEGSTFLRERNRSAGGFTDEEWDELLSLEADPLGTGLGDVPEDEIMTGYRPGDIFRAEPSS